MQTEHAIEYNQRLDNHLSQQEESLLWLANSIQEELDLANRDSKPVIQDIMFREVFLPFFANDEVKKYPNVTLQHWLNIAGNAFQDVSIVNSKGEHVLTVPPLYDRDILAIKDPVGDSWAGTGERRRLKEVWSVVSLLKERSPNQAEQMFLEEIRGRLVDTGSDVKVFYHAEAWNKIYEYFGREIPFPQARANVAVLNNDENVPESIKVAEPNKEEKKETIKLGNTTALDQDDYDFEPF